MPPRRRRPGARRAVRATLGAAIVGTEPLTELATGPGDDFDVVTMVAELDRPGLGGLRDASAPEPVDHQDPWRHSNSFQLPSAATKPAMRALSRVRRMRRGWSNERTASTTRSHAFHTITIGIREERGPPTLGPAHAAHRVACEPPRLRGAHVVVAAVVHDGHVGHEHHVVARSCSRQNHSSSSQ